MKATSRSAGRMAHVGRARNQAAPGILVLLPNLQGAYGGIASFNRTLVQALVPLARRHGSKVTVLALMDAKANGDGPHLSLDGLSYEAFGGDRLRFSLKVIGEGRRAGVLVIGHVHFSPLALLSRASRAFLIVHGVDAWRRFGAFSRMSFRRYDRILAVSAFTRDRMAQLNALDADQFAIFPNALSPTHELGERWMTRQELELPEGPMLLSVARLARTERPKGISDVIASLPRILEHWPNASYVIVGDGDDRRALEALAAHAGVAGSVHFVGAVRDDLLRSYYRAADIFVLPSGKEGFGIVFLEAMYQGRPCVGGNTGGTPEVVTDGATGFLVAPGDRDRLTERLTQLLCDAGLRLRMGEMGRQRVEDRYTLRSMSERLERLLWQ